MPLDRGASDELIRRFLPSVRKIAGAMARRGPTRQALFDDVYSAGLEGLVRGAAGYDPARGPAKGYLERRISGAILDFLRGEDHLSRDQRRLVRATGIDPWPFALRLDDDAEADLHEVIPNARAEDPAELATRRRDLVAIERAARVLPPRTREVLRLYYLEDLTQQEIGDRLGVVETRVCQLMREAHNVIRAALGEPPLPRSPRAPYSRRPRPPVDPAGTT